MPGYESVYEALREHHGLDDEASAEMLDTLQTAIAATAEMEEIVAEARGSTESGST